MNTSPKIIIKRFFGKLTSIRVFQRNNVEREKKDQVGHLLSLLGFLIVILTGLANSLMNLSNGISTLIVILGILMLISGVELVIRNRPDNSTD